MAGALLLHAESAHFMTARHLPCRWQRSWRSVRRQILCRQLSPRQHRFTAQRAIGQRREGSWRFFPAEGEADVRSQPAVRHQRGQDGQVLAEGLLWVRTDEANKVSVPALGIEIGKLELDAAAARVAGSLDSPSAASAVNAMICAIGAASGCVAGERAPRNA